MPLYSMTGFSRCDGAVLGQRWTWELRSVNGKGLDVRLRLPPGLDRLEIAARERLTRRLARGNVQGGLTLAAFWLGDLFSLAQIDVLSATGGVILIALGIRLLKIKDIPVGDLLPALVVAPILIQVVAAFR